MQETHTANRCGTMEKEFAVTVNEETCINCGICMDACPIRTLDMTRAQGFGPEATFLRAEPAGAPVSDWLMAVPVQVDHCNGCAIPRAADTRRRGHVPASSQLGSPAPDLQLQLCARDRHVLCIVGARGCDRDVHLWLRAYAVGAEARPSSNGRRDESSLTGDGPLTAGAGLPAST